MPCGNGYCNTLELIDVLLLEGLVEYWSNRFSGIGLQKFGAKFGWQMEAEKEKILEIM